MRRARRWTIILIPPEPRARTRRVSISLRPLATSAAITAAVVVAVGLWAAAATDSVALTNDQLASAQRAVLVLSDSMRVLNDHLLARKDSLPSMIMPVEGEITSKFSQSRLEPLLQIFRPHRGIDVSAPAGTKIVAPAAGTVRFVGWRLGDGLTVELSHAGDVVTRYAHCSRTLVHVGDQVTAGEPIATVGSSGLATGPHVHFEVLVHGTAVDPMRFLADVHDTASTVTADRVSGGGQ